MPKCPLCLEDLHWSGDHDDGERSWGDYYHDECGVWVTIYLDGKTAMGEEIESEQEKED
jgi:hypothetical protein